MNEFAIKIDDQCSIAVPELHDASVYRIDFGRKRLSLYCRCSDRQCVRLNLDAVVHMTSSGIAEQNILLDVSVQGGEDVSADVIYSMLPAITEAQEGYRSRILFKLRQNELKLIQFAPSYGGSISVICENVSYELLSCTESDEGSAPVKM